MVAPGAACIDPPDTLLIPQIAVPVSDMLLCFSAWGTRSNPFCLMKAHF